MMIETFEFVEMPHHLVERHADHYFVIASPNPNIQWNFRVGDESEEYQMVFDSQDTLNLFVSKCKNIVPIQYKCKKLSEVLHFKTQRHFMLLTHIDFGFKREYRVDQAPYVSKTLRGVINTTRGMAACSFTTLHPNPEDGEW